MSRISFLTSGLMRFLPFLRGRLFQRQNSLNPCRCHLITVSGFTMTRASLQLFRSLEKRRNIALSVFSRLGFFFTLEYCDLMSQQQNLQLQLISRLKPIADQPYQGFECVYHKTKVSAKPLKINGVAADRILTRHSHVYSRLSPLFFGGGQQNNKRPGTIPVAQVVGVAKALKILIDDGNEEQSRIRNLRDIFFKTLSSRIEGITLNGVPLSNRHPGNLNIAIRGIDSEDLLARLQPLLAASTGSACSSGIPGPSRVLRTIGLGPKCAASSLRLCFGRFTDQSQSDEIIEILATNIEMIRNED